MRNVQHFFDVDDLLSRLSRRLSAAPLHGVNPQPAVERHWRNSYINIELFVKVCLQTTSMVTILSDSSTWYSVAGLE